MRSDAAFNKRRLRMGAGFESQWDAAWFRTRAEQCFRLATSITQPADAEILRVLGRELEAQAKVAQDKQSEAKP